MSIIEVVLNEITHKKILREPIKEIFNYLVCVPYRSFKELEILTGYAESTLKKALNQAINLKIVSVIIINNDKVYCVHKDEEHEADLFTFLNSTEKTIVTLLLRDVSHREIANTLNTSRQRIDYYANKFVNKHILEREPDEEDPRRYVYNIIEV